MAKLIIGAVLGFFLGLIFVHYGFTHDDREYIKNTNCKCGKCEPYDPQANPNIKPTENERPNCRYPRWSSVDEYWVCCHGGINCGSCGAWPENCKEK